MDTLSFVAEMTKALAWPLTLLAVIWLLRRPLAELIPLVERLRYGNLELSFGRRVQELAAEAESELPPALGREGPNRALWQHFAQLAPLSPRAVVLEAWLEVESAAMEARRRLGVPLTGREARTPLLLGQALEQAGLLDEPKLEIFHRLRNLRNAATHASEFDLDPEAALEYADLALRLAAYLREPGASREP